VGAKIEEKKIFAMSLE